MPADAPKSKLEATRAQGAKIVEYDRFRDDRAAIGARIAAETGATLVPPFDHPWIIAGQGTIGLEILEDLPEVEAVFAPVGGGGLLEARIGIQLLAHFFSPSCFACSTGIGRDSG